MPVADHFQFLLTTLYAPACAACDKPVSVQQGLCSSCLQSCEAIVIACPICAAPLSGPAAVRCARCRLGRPVLDSCTAAYEYGGQLAVALRRLKFQGRSDIAKSIRPLLMNAFASAAERADLALPVPLHRKRLTTRGFNQSQRLLIPLAGACDIPVARSALRRTRHTEPQARLSAKARWTNLQGAFEAKANIRGKRILLVDDVRTTGATLDAAARALRRAGATEVHAFVAARAEWSM